MLQYNNNQIRNAIAYYDQMLRGLEASAEGIGYPIDEDSTYIQATAVITNIQCLDIEPSLELWINLGYYIGMVRSRLLNYKGKA